MTASLEKAQRTDMLEDAVETAAGPLFESALAVVLLAQTIEIDRNR